MLTPEQRGELMRVYLETGNYAAAGRALGRTAQRILACWSARWEAYDRSLVAWRESVPRASLPPRAPSCPRPKRMPSGHTPRRTPRYAVDAACFERWSLGLEATEPLTNAA